jgi:hypothetical protein
MHPSFLPFECVIYQLLLLMIEETKRSVLKMSIEGCSHVRSHERASQPFVGEQQPQIQMIALVVAALCSCAMQDYDERSHFALQAQLDFESIIVRNRGSPALRFRSEPPSRARGASPQHCVCRRALG